jgi:hypothetical protein
MVQLLQQQQHVLRVIIMDISQLIVQILKKNIGQNVLNVEVNIVQQNALQEVELTF